MATCVVSHGKYRSEILPVIFPKEILQECNQRKYV